MNPFVCEHAAGPLPEGSAAVAAAGAMGTVAAVGAGSAAVAYRAVDHERPPSSTSPTRAAMANDTGSAQHANHRDLPPGMTTFANTPAQSPATEGMHAPPAKDASMDEIKAWVEIQLDQIGSTPLLNRFVLLGPHERRRGGAPIATSALRVHIAAGTVLMPCSRFGCF